MPNPVDSLPADVVDAWRAGNKIEAIRRLRAATSMGLAEAKAAIDALEGHAGAGRPAASGPQLPEMLKALQASGALPPDVLEAWQRGDKLEALKRFADAAKSGRINANVTVKTNVHHAHPAVGLEAPKHAARPVLPHDALAPGEVPRTKLGPAVIVLLVVALVALAWIYKTLA